MQVTKLESKKERQGVKSAVIVDENGYYKILLGAFNTYNRAGTYYRIKNPSLLLTNKTILNRRITEGTLRSEEEHPDYKGMSDREIVRRTIFLDSKNICAHIKTVEFVDTGKCEPGWDGYNITLVYGWIKPTGTHGPTLKESLDNEDENVYFSVRSLVRERYIGSTLVRDVLDVSTWDHVYEGGIKVASQWNAVGIEDIGICVDGMCDLVSGNVTAGTEAMDCEDGKCLMENMKKIKDEMPLVMEW
jgi:hypothetical protein